jgi:tRNA 2-thiouridine synthesizing protein A
MNFDKELDARGLNCPLPILRAKKTLAELQPGQILRIIATDPGSIKDFAAFAKQTGNELLGSSEKDKEFEFFLKRKEFDCSCRGRLQCPPRRLKRPNPRLSRGFGLLPPCRSAWGCRFITTPNPAIRIFIWMLHCDS